MLFRHRHTLLPLLTAGAVALLFWLSTWPAASASESIITMTPSATSSFPTMTPSTPYIQLSPDCGRPPYVEFDIRGYNWHTGDVDLSWEGEVLETSVRSIVATRWRIANLLPGVYTVAADNGAARFEAKFTVADDCIIPTATQPPTRTPFATFTPWATATPWATHTPGSGSSPTSPPSFTPPTPTPPPGTLGPDLVILAVEPLITPPLREYTPLPFRVQIANPSPVGVIAQFFLDIFLDPDPASISPTSIGLSGSSGYLAVSSLVAGGSRTITVTADYGLVSNGAVAGMRRVYTMIDSSEVIAEPLDGEFNNILGPIYIANVTPGPTRTPTPTPSVPNDGVAGTAFINRGGWLPQPRAAIFLIRVDDIETQVGHTVADENGQFSFNNVPILAGVSYRLVACLNQDASESYVGTRNGIVPPNAFADLFMSASSAGCPWPQLAPIHRQYLPFMGAD